MKRWGLAVITMLLAVPGIAVPVEKLPSTWKQNILPYYNSSRAGEFRSRDGKATLRYRVFPGEDAMDRGAIVFLAGQGEPILKYAELFYDLRKSGYAIYALDHRGQGTSDRLPGTAKKRKGYIDRFEDYVDDLHQFVTEVVDREAHGRKFLLAHSMGGAVGTLYLAGHPGEFTSAVFSSPMYELNTKPYPAGVARVLTEGLVTAGQGKQFAPGKSRFNQPRSFEDKSNVFNGCKQRFALAQDLSKTRPELFLNGPTNRWVQQAMKADREIALLRGTVPVPVLIFQAGRDQIVRVRAHDAFVSAQAKSGHGARIMTFSSAQHEIFVECDTVRVPALKAAIDFFSATSARSPGSAP